MQLSYLNDISRRKNIPVIITNHIYHSFDDKSKVNVIGGDMIKNIAKCLIELVKHNKNNRSAILRKHRSRPESDPITFEIYEKGFRTLQEDNQIQNKEEIIKEEIIKEEIKKNINFQ